MDSGIDWFCWGNNSKKCHNKSRRRLTSTTSAMFRTPPQSREASPPRQATFSFLSPVEKPPRLYRRVVAPPYKQEKASPVDKKKLGYNPSDRFLGFFDGKPKKFGGRRATQKKLKRRTMSKTYLL